MSANRAPPRWCAVTGGGPCGQVGSRARLQVERLELVSPPSAATEQHRRIAPERDTRPGPGAERLCAAGTRRAPSASAAAPGALRRVELAGLETCLRGGQRAPHAERRVGGQAGGPFEQCRCRREAAAALARVLRSARGRQPRLRPVPAAASARCHARRSAASSGSLAFASASCTSRRWSGVAAWYTAERISGWRNRTWSSTSSSPASVACVNAPGSVESCSAARHSNAASPSGSAAASSISRCVASGKAATRRSVLRLQLTWEIARRVGGQAPSSLSGTHRLRQLHKCQRVAPGLGDDPVADAVIEPTRYGSRQQSARIGLCESLKRQLRKAVERAGGGWLA